MSAAALASDLVAAIGSDHVLVDDDLRAGYEVDWTGRYRGPSVAVVRPGTTAEVAAALQVCASHEAHVVTQAGNTGLVGGGVPRAGGGGNNVVLSLQRMTQVSAVDTASMQITAGAGVTLSDWRRAARAASLDTPVDFAARDSATIGGAIATNAGGSRVLRFGTMRQQIVGIEAVLSNGAVVGGLRSLPKETAGLHWPSVLAGSEGTLAVITAARLRLVPWYRQTTTAFVALESVDAAIDLLGDLRRSAPSLDAAEMISPAALELVAEHLGRRPPVADARAAIYVMVDCADHDDPTTQLTDVLARSTGLIDAAVTTDAAQRTDLIAFRDRITEAIAAASTSLGTPTFKLDVAVPLDAIGRLLDVAARAADHDGCRLIPFGHLAEGNLHLNHLGATDTGRIADTVLAEVAALGGTISAEHGIGVAKTPWLRLIRSPDELAAQAAIRTALDPTGTLNRGVLES